MSFFTLPNLKDVSGQNQLNITTNDVETQPEDSTDKTAKAKQNLKLFNQFCSTVTPFLTGNEEMVGFLQKRFHAASDMFKASEDLQNLLNTTLMKILKDKNNVFVHIRDLNNEFKAYRGSKVHKKRRRGHGDGSGTDSSCIEASDEKKRRINGKQNGDFGLLETSDSTYISDTSVSTHLKQNHSKQKDNSSRTNSPILELNPTREITNKTLHRLTIYEAEETTSDPDSKRTPKTILNGSKSDSETPQSTGASRIFNKNSNIKLHNIGAAGRKDPEEWTDPGEGCSGLADTNKPDDHEDLLNDAKVALEDDPEQSQSEGEGRRKEKKKGSAKQLKKLEDLLEKISKKIQALSEQELDFNDLDHEDSTYLQEEKLKRHFMKIWKRICQLKERSDATGRLTETKFKFEGTRYPDINKRIERFINKTRQFPDYHDIRKEIMKTNQKKGLKLGKRSIDELSKEAFIEVGNSLQSRRKDDFVKDFGCHMTDTYREFDDPALYDRDLKRKLEQNKHIGHNRLEAVISKFTYKQEVDGDSTADTDESESELPANQSGAESTNEEANGKKDSSRTPSPLSPNSQSQEQPEMLVLSDDNSDKEQTGPEDKSLNSKPTPKNITSMHSDTTVIEDNNRHKSNYETPKMPRRIKVSDLKSGSPRDKSEPKPKSDKHSSPGIKPITSNDTTTPSIKSTNPMSDTTLDAKFVNPTVDTTLDAKFVNPTVDTTIDVKSVNPTDDTTLDVKSVNPTDDTSLDVKSVNPTDDVESDNEITIVIDDELPEICVTPRDRTPVDIHKQNRHKRKPETIFDSQDSQESQESDIAMQENDWDLLEDPTSAEYRESSSQEILNDTTNLDSDVELEQMPMDTCDAPKDNDVCIKSESPRSVDIIGVNVISNNDDVIKERKKTEKDAPSEIIRSPGKKIRKSVYKPSPSKLKLKVSKSFAERTKKIIIATQNKSAPTSDEEDPTEGKDNNGNFNEAATSEDEASPNLFEDQDIDSNPESSKPLNFQNDNNVKLDTKSKQKIDASEDSEPITLEIDDEDDVNKPEVKKKEKISDESDTSLDDEIKSKMEVANVIFEEIKEKLNGVQNVDSDRLSPKSEGASNGPNQKSTKEQSPDIFSSNSEDSQNPTSTEVQKKSRRFAKLGRPSTKKRNTGRQSIEIIDDEDEEEKEVSYSEYETDFSSIIDSQSQDLISSPLRHSTPSKPFNRTTKVHNSGGKHSNPKIKTVQNSGLTNQIKTSTKNTSTTIGKFVTIDHYAASRDKIVAPLKTATNAMGSKLTKPISVATNHKNSQSQRSPQFSPGLKIESYRSLSTNDEVTVRKPKVNQPQTKSDQTKSGDIIVLD